MEVKFKRLHPNAVLPSYAHPGEDAGLDLVCTEISSNYEYDYYKIGLSVEIPIGYVGLLFPRSSNCKKDLLLSNSVGVVDSGYRGEIELRYRKISTNKYPEVLKLYSVGDKVGQLLILPYPTIEPIEVEELTESKRGEGGYGSTGK